MSEEQWKWIIGYEGRYMASTHGRIRSMDRKIERAAGHQNKFPRFHTGGEMAVFKNHNGYLEVGLWNGKRQIKYRVHRLILIAFKPVDNVAEMTVNHIDGDRINNDLENLEWTTQAENIQHSYKYLNRRPNIISGSQNGKSKPVAMYKDGIKVRIFESGRQAAKYLGVTNPSVQAAMKPNRTVKGYTFQLI